MQEVWRDVKLSAGKILISGVASHATDFTNKLTKHRLLSMTVGKTKLVNIGPKETRKRLLMGVAMLALGVALAAIFTHADVSRGWYSVLFLPFWMGTLGISQARKKT